MLATQTAGSCAAAAAGNCTAHDRCPSLAQARASADAAAMSGGAFAKARSRRSRLPRPRTEPRPEFSLLARRPRRRWRGLPPRDGRQRGTGLLQREEQAAAFAAAVLRRFVELAGGLAAQHQFALLVLGPQLDVRVGAAALFPQLGDAAAAGQLIARPDDLDEPRRELAYVPAPQPRGQDLPDERHRQHP